MSIFDTLVQAGIQAALGSNGQHSQDQTQNLVSGVLSMLQSEQVGGVAGLLDKFKQSGLGDVAASWISNGANQPVSPAQLVDALGQGQINELAQQAGIPPEKGASVLSELLPSLIDKLSPDGTAPDSNTLGTIAKVALGGAGVVLAAKAVSSMFGSDAQAAEAPATAGISPQVAEIAASVAPTAQVNTYTVASGDTLSKIAKHVYGDANAWGRIFEANRDQLSNPDRIMPGQVLRLP